jgi:iron(III) transport system permease protein
VAVSLTGTGFISFVNYIQLVSVDELRTPLINSMILGGLTVLVCGMVGTFLAFFIHFFQFPGKQVIDKLLLLPMMLPGVIIVFSFVQLYGESGLVTKTIQILFGLENPPFDVSGLSGILFIHAYTQYVYFYISVSIAIRHIDVSVIESAQNLGASRFVVFKTIVLPFILPALVASSLITFMSGIGSFTAPSIIGQGFKVLTTQILLSKANNYMEVAATQVTALTIICLFAFALFRWYEKKVRFDSSVKGVPFQPVRIENRLVKLLLVVFAWGVILMVLLPVAAIMFLSFVPSETWMVKIYPDQFSWQNFVDIFTRSRKFSPFFNSIFMALIAAFAGMIIALPASYFIVKTKLRFKWFLEMMCMLPWAMPASAIAINLINGFNHKTIFSFNHILVGTSILLPVGYILKSLPIMVKTFNLSLGGLSDNYIEASQSLGARPLQTLKRVVFPLLAPGILAGFLLVFIRSIGEYTVTVFLYTVSNKPVSIAMVNAIFEYNIGLAMAYGTLLIIISVVSSFAITKIAVASL